MQSWFRNAKVNSNKTGAPYITIFFCFFLLPRLQCVARVPAFERQRTPREADAQLNYSSCAAARHQRRTASRLCEDHTRYGGIVLIIPIARAPPFLHLNWVMKYSERKGEIGPFRPVFRVCLCLYARTYVFESTSPTSNKRGESAHSFRLSHARCGMSETSLETSYARHASFRSNRRQYRRLSR